MITWNAVTVDGVLWAYRRNWPNGDYQQYTPASLRNLWSNILTTDRREVMQYFSVVTR